MKSRALVVLAAIVLILGTVLPVDAWRGGGGHGGGHSFHHGGGCCWWGGAAVFGALAFGAALTYPYYGYPYAGYPYAYGYPYAAYPYYAAQPAVVYQQPAVAQSRPPALAQSVGAQPATSGRTAVQREVSYPNGKYVLYGDGVTRAWQWVWMPAAEAPVSAAR